MHGSSIVFSLEPNEKLDSEAFCRVLEFASHLLFEWNVQILYARGSTFSRTVSSISKSIIYTPFSRISANGLARFSIA